MELLYISKSRMKITLTEPEMKKYRICEGNGYYFEKDVRETFKNIISDGMRECPYCADFDCMGDRLFVQLFVSKNGGCEMFVTRIGENENDSTDEPHDSVTYEGSEEDFSETLKEAYRATLPSAPQVRYSARRMYVFSKLSDLCAVCKILSRRQEQMQSTVYYDDNKHYHLSLYVSPALSLMSPDSLSFITEYGNAESISDFESIKGEHTRVICENDAVDVIKQY